MDVVNPEQVRLSALSSSLCVPSHEHTEESRTTGLTCVVYCSTSHMLYLHRHV